MSDVSSPRFCRGYCFAAALKGSAANIGYLSLAFGVGLVAFHSEAYATCTTSSNITTCDPLPLPNPYPSRVGAGKSPDGDNQTVIVNENAGISSGDDSAISLRDGAIITVDGTVQNYAINNMGGYNTGANTIEFRDGGKLTIGVNGAVLSNGTQRIAEAINVQGANNTIINKGRINAVSGAAIWSQNSGKLTIENDGTISTGALATPNYTAAVIGGNINAGIDFTNRGKVYGSLNLGTGSDTLRLYTGSLITGNFSGGGGSGIDSIYLNGLGSDTLGGTMTGFEYLYKQDAGTWELTGSITGLIAADVKDGTLILSGDNSGFTGITTVQVGGTLQGRAQSLPTKITNDGIVRFDQLDTGTYAGVITGPGGLEKTGAGVVTLSSALAYGGATTVKEGTLVLEGDNRGYTGGATVLANATLQGAGESLPVDIVNAGLVRIDQASDGLYAGVISGAGGLEKTGPGRVTISSAQTYTGPTIIAHGTLELTGSLVSSTTVDAGGTLSGSGSITGSVFNSGTIAPGTEKQIGTFTINGPYVGDGGILSSRVGGTPDAPVADVLRISGAGATASGTTGVRVVDAGGLGAPTTGDGILLVQAANGATTGTDSFVLADRVAGGAYEYFLVRGVSAGAGQNWYLSTYEEPPEPPGPGPDPEPVYRIETSTYTALPALQRLYTYGLVDTLEQRRGSLATLAVHAADDRTAIWGRVGGAFGKTPGSGANDLDLSYDFGFLQAGADAVSASDGYDGRLDAGVFLALGQSSTEISTAADGNTGDAALTAYSAGLYGTWLAADGLYGDVLAQVTRFANANSHSAGGESISTGGYSQSLSLETGYRVALGARASLVPQGQIIAENFSLQGTSDDFGDVDFGDGFAARGRLGLELGSAVDALGSRTNLTLRANVWHVFADNPQTTFTNLEGDDPVSFDTDIGDSWLAVDAGFTTALGDGASLFANAGYEYGFGDSRQAGTGRLGFTYDW